MMETVIDVVIVVSFLSSLLIIGLLVEILSALKNDRERYLSYFRSLYATDTEKTDDD